MMAPASDTSTQITLFRPTGWKQQNYHTPSAAVIGGSCCYIIDSSSMSYAGPDNVLHLILHGRGEAILRIHGIALRRSDIFWLSQVLVMYVDLKKVLCFYPQPPRRVCEKTGEWSEAWVAESELDPDPISFCNWAATIKVPFRCSFSSFNFAFRSTHIFDWYTFFFSLSSKNSSFNF